MLSPREHLHKDTGMPWPLKLDALLASVLSWYGARGLYRTTRGRRGWGNIFFEGTHARRRGDSQQVTCELVLKEREQKETYWRKELAGQGQDEGLQATPVRAIQTWLSLVIINCGKDLEGHYPWATGLENTCLTRQGSPRASSVSWFSVGSKEASFWDTHPRHLEAEQVAFRNITKLRAQRKKDGLDRLGVWLRLYLPCL